MGLGLMWVGFDMGWVWYWFGMVWYGMIWNGLVYSIMSNGSLCFILDEGLETFLEIRDLEIYILLIYMVTRLQNYRTYRLLALFSFKYCIFRKNFEKPCAFHEFYMQVGWSLS